jgi:hypothetical protein
MRPLSEGEGRLLIGAVVESAVITHKTLAMTNRGLSPRSTVTSLSRYYSNKFHSPLKRLKHWIADTRSRHSDSGITTLNKPWNNTKSTGAVVKDWSTLDREQFQLQLFQILWEKHCNPLTIVSCRHAFYLLESGTINPLHRINTDTSIDRLILWHLREIMSGKWICNPQSLAVSLHRRFSRRPNIAH